MTHPWFEGSTVPRVLAHRGLVTTQDEEHGVVENSFAAVAAAHAAGAAYIESDCHLTRDGTVVLVHDADLSRVVGDPRQVRDVDVRELERLLAERGGLITLEQALDAFPTTRFNLDVKAKDAATEIGRLVAPHAHRVLLASFSDVRRRAALDAAERAGARIRPATSAGSQIIARLLLGLTLRSDRIIHGALRDVDAVQVPERQGRIHVMTPRLIDAAHRHGVEVHVWTINDQADMHRLVALGADGVVTDRADIALRELGAAR